MQDFGFKPQYLSPKTAFHLENLLVAEGKLMLLLFPWDTSGFRAAWGGAKATWRSGTSLGSSQDKLEKPGMTRAPHTSYRKAALGSAKGNPTVDRLPREVPRGYKNVFVCEPQAWGTSAA
jgi:hypothetical protein